MGTMTFKNNDAFRAMVEYCNAPNRKPKGAYDTRLKPDTKVCLWLVHDQGVYLMPGIEDGGKAEHVIYARGCDPVKNEETWWDRSRELVGGDDFAESVELPAEAVAAVLDGRVEKLVIRLTETSMSQTLHTTKAKA